jgi:hypothetical protein
MRFDLPNGRVRVGLLITDTSKDIEIKGGIDFALAVSEQYCDRRFAWQVETSKFYLTSRAAFVLERAPVTRLRSITSENSIAVPSSKYKMHYNNGTLLFDSQFVTRELEVIYEGGYNEFPADLRIAMWGLFDNYWAEFGAGARAVDVKEIQSVTVPDVGTVRYFEKGGSTVDLAGQSGSHFRLLDFYKRTFV